MCINKTILFVFANAKTKKLSFKGYLADEYFLWQNNVPLKLFIKQKALYQSQSE